MRSAPPGGGANIGAGLASFGATILLCAAWGLLDGRRERAVGPLVLRWGVVGLLVGVTQVVVIPLKDRGPIDPSVLASDLTMVAPFLVGLVAVPAIVAALLGSTVAPSEG